MRLLERLRQETRDQHQQLHQLVDLERMAESLENYVSVLMAVYRALAPAEAGVARALARTAAPAPEFGGWHQRLRKRNWLRDDLALLGVPDAVLAEPAPALEADESSVSAIVGRTYVLEGMTLGAARIAPLLSARLGVSKDTGGRFYHGYGPEAGQMWKAYQQWVTGQTADGDVAVRWARSMFSLFASSLADRPGGIKQAVCHA